jgi:hypothetical protein
MPMNDEIGTVAGETPLESTGFDTSEKEYYAQPKMDLSFLKAETGEGDLAEYVYHTLNYNQSKGMARVIRGFTGMFGSLNFAVVDIVIGIFDLTSKKKTQWVVPDGDFSKYGDSGVY